MKNEYTVTQKQIEKIRKENIKERKYKQKGKMRMGESRVKCQTESKEKTEKMK